VNLQRWIAFCLLLVSFSTLADSPLPPPQRTAACSGDKRFCAVSHPADQLTVVTADSASKPLWPGWHRWMLVQAELFVVLGRIFDQNTRSRPNIYRLMSAAQAHPEIFAPEAFEARRRRSDPDADG
jgi:hypothetical protein